MELRHLRSFLTVADELNVGRAAALLHMTQPTLSRQIAALEQDLGVPLFARVRRRFVLTPAGAVFRAAAQDVVRRADDAADAARRAHRGELGTLRLRFVQSATFEAVPRLLSAFRAAYPAVTLDVEAMVTLRQLTALRAGEIDVGLLRLPIDAPDLRTMIVSRDGLVAALPAGHRLAPADEVPLAALAGESFVFYTRSFGPSVHDGIVGQCQAAGFSPRIVQEAGDVQTIMALVAAGLGVSLLIGPTPPPSAAVVCRPIADDLPRWDMALAWSPENPAPALPRFLALADA